MKNENIPKVVELAQDYFENTLHKGEFLAKIGEKYTDNEIQNEWQNFLIGFNAAYGQYSEKFEDVNGNIVWDLDLAMWNSIKDASTQSNWMPEEYFMNDWVADVCEMLRGPQNKDF